MNSILFVLCTSLVICHSARILMVLPVPSISHQMPFWPLTKELARRGHQVTVLTTDPAFPKGQAPENLTEIDLHDSYSLWNTLFVNKGLTGERGDIIHQVNLFSGISTIVMDYHMHCEQVQTLLKSKPQYDLLILDATVRPILLYSHIFKGIPVIQVNSMTGLNRNFEVMGAPEYPIFLYPTQHRQRLFNLSLWEKIKQFYIHFRLQYIFYRHNKIYDMKVKELWGDDTPSLRVLEDNVVLLMLNVHPVWDFNRPVPPSIVYMGGIDQKPTKDLPTDLKSYLDASVHGVIYVSFGTNVLPSMLPPERIQILINVFSKLPYDVLWKWDKDQLAGVSSNVKLMKWVPQSDLLKHPKLKAFITQGGLQSTEEAIIAGVPLIGIPMLGDQWYNVEQYVHHKIGIRLDLEDITEEKLFNGINTVINDGKNVVRLRSIMYDQPQSALSRAVWWTEHVLRHGGRHLRAPAANLSWGEYLDVQLLSVFAIAIALLITIVSTALWYLVKVLRSFRINKKVKVKKN